MKRYRMILKELKSLNNCKINLSTFKMKWTGIYVLAQSYPYGDEPFLRQMCFLTLVSNTIMIHLNYPKVTRNDLLLMKKVANKMVPMLERYVTKDSNEDDIRNARSFFKEFNKIDNEITLPLINIYTKDDEELQNIIKEGRFYFW